MQSAASGLSIHFCWWRVGDLALAAATPVQIIELNPNDCLRCEATGRINMDPTPPRLQRRNVELIDSNGVVIAGTTTDLLNTSFLC
jgi:hypothetical protein